MNIKMKIHDNLKRIHLEEESIRNKTINFIECDLEMSKHFLAMHDSLDIINYIIRNYKNKTDDELVIMRLGIRMFNSISSSIKLGLSGYYQTAYSHIRDIVETSFLLYYFRCFPETINEWENLDEDKRKKMFSPFKIRIAIDSKDGFTEKKREKMYKLLCNYATHPTPEGFMLFSPNNSSVIGPFFEEKRFISWVQELIKCTNILCTTFVVFFNDDDSLKSQEHYVKSIEEWTNEFL